MTNEEKKQYLIDWHRALMRHHDAAEVDHISNVRALAGYSDFLKEFFETLYPRMPKQFFRYRRFTENELKNLKDGTARFSHPDQFDDCLDSTLNIDLEKEVDEIMGPNGDAKLKADFAVSFIDYLLRKMGIQLNREMIADAFAEIEQSDFDKGLLGFYGRYLDERTSRTILDWTKTQLESVCTDQLKENVIGWVNLFQDSNSKIRASVYDLCLAEEGDNDAMWGTYADGGAGFCIRYEIPPNSRLGAMILSNLFPIYYGEREEIRLTDILREGVFNPNKEMKIGSMRQSDYERIHVSSYTKTPNWAFQKEWRVTYGDTELQPFPFATAIILGERMSEENRVALIEIASEKGLAVFQRTLNRSHSKIRYIQLK